MNVTHAGQTDVGLRRAHNEDTFLADPGERLFVVADGMGGYACGEVASQLSVETLAHFFEATSEDSELTWPCNPDDAYPYDTNRLIAGIKLANQRIWEQAQSDDRYHKMGTTIAGALFHEGGVSVAHVGDSRVYRLRGGELQQLTEDHSLLNNVRKWRELTEEEIKSFPYKNVVVRALGIRETVEVDVRTVEPTAGDVYLICSDGLTGELDDHEIRQILLDHSDLDTACHSLVEAANAKGGRDNVTALVIRVC